MTIEPEGDTYSALIAGSVGAGIMDFYYYAKKSFVLQLRRAYTLDWICYPTDSEGH